MPEEIEVSVVDRPQRNAGLVYDRRHVSLPALIAIITLILQLGALVWGAATLKSSVDNLSVLAREMQKDIRNVQTDMSALKVDVGILKAKEPGK